MEYEVTFSLGFVPPGPGLLDVVDGLDQGCTVLTTPHAQRQVKPARVLRVRVIDGIEAQSKDPTSQPPVHPPLWLRS